MMITKGIGKAALVVALVGLAAAVATVYVHYQLLINPSYTSFCDVGSTVSCTEVYQSRYSTVGGVPVGLMGAVFFAVAGALSMAGLRGPGKVRENVPGYLFVLSTAGLAAVIYLAYVSFVVLKAICLLCVTMDLAVVALFLMAGAATSYPVTTVPRRAIDDLRMLARSPLALAVVVLMLAGTATALAFFPREGEKALAAAGAPPPPPLEENQQTDFEREWVKQPRVSLPIPRDGAKVLIVKFNDYQCPPCRQTYLSYKDIFAKYQAERPGEVRLVLKDFPLDVECNRNLAGSLHPAGCAAAVAVRLARPKGKAEAMEEWLFANQPSLTPPLVRDGLRQVAGVADFDLQYNRTLTQVKADIDMGTQLGVRVTPTFFINGVKWEGGLQPQYFDAAIAYELKHAPPPDR